jgi:hypothetical protein
MSHAGAQKLPVVTANNHGVMGAMPVDPNLLERANWWFDVSWYGLLIAGFIAAVAACATIAFLFAQYWSSGIRERQAEWRTSTLEFQTADAKRDTAAAGERIAELNRETERLRGDNLALQTVLLPRHAGLIGFNRAPPAQEWFAALQAFAGVQVYIQVVKDSEAQNLANEIAIILSRFGLNPSFIDETRSHLDQSRIMDGVSISYPVGKAWTSAEPNPPWAVWSNAAESIANALTRAGLGVGDKPVSRYGFANEPDPMRMQPTFDPPLSGVFLQVGARPVEATLQWIKQGRPDPLGNPPSATAPEPNSRR